MYRVGFLFPTVDEPLSEDFSLFRWPLFCASKLHPCRCSLVRVLVLEPPGWWHRGQNMRKSTVELRWYASDVENLEMPSLQTKCCCWAGSFCGVNFRGPNVCNEEFNTPTGTTGSPHLKRISWGRSTPVLPKWNSLQDLQHLPERRLRRSVQRTGRGFSV